MKKRVSIKDVASLAGVSPGTVSNYLNNSAPVNPDTSNRIKKAIETLGYRRNELASSLRRAQSRTIGLILPDIRNPFYADFYYSVEQEARVEGYNVVYGNSDYDRANIEHYIDLFISRRVDGIIVSGNYSFRLKSIVENADIPIVVFEPKDIHAVFPSLAIDNIQASAKMVDYLIKLGHNRIAVITSSRRSPRFLGYQQALLENGIPIDDNLIFEFGQFTRNLFERGYQGMEALLERTRFSACFVMADLLALGAISAASDKGLRVPDDMAIAGFDNIPFSGIVQPGLTTVAQPVEIMGKDAVILCLGLINEGTHIWTGTTKIYETSVIKRSSA